MKTLDMLRSVMQSNELETLRVSAQIWETLGLGALGKSYHFLQIGSDSTLVEKIIYVEGEDNGN